jgi:hypothetical protein
LIRRPLWHHLLVQGIKFKQNQLESNGPPAMPQGSPGSFALQPIAPSQWARVDVRWGWRAGGSPKCESHGIAQPQKVPKGTRRCQNARKLSKVPLYPPARRCLAACTRCCLKSWTSPPTIPRSCSLISLFFSSPPQNHQNTRNTCNRKRLRQSSRCDKSLPPFKQSPHTNRQNSVLRLFQH